MSDPKPASYRPSAFYFRRELRNSKTKAQAVAVGLHVVREIDHLMEWARVHRIPPTHLVFSFGAEALRGAKTKADAVEAGLRAVRELEYLKEWIRGQGLIPPKRFVLRSEAEEKQWAAE